MQGDIQGISNLPLVQDVITDFCFGLRNYKTRRALSFVTLLKMKVLLVPFTPHQPKQHFTIALVMMVPGNSHQHMYNTGRMSNHSRNASPKLN